MAAAHDKYVPAESVAYIHQIWKGSTLWQIDGGHVSSFLLADLTYREGIRQALDKLDV